MFKNFWMGSFFVSFYGGNKNHFSKKQKAVAHFFLFFSFFVSLVLLPFTIKNGRKSPTFSVERY